VIGQEAHNSSVTVTPPQREHPLLRINHRARIVAYLLACATGDLRVCNAGHPRPLVLSADGTLGRGLADATAEVVVTPVIDAARKFAGPTPQADDIAAMAIRFERTAVFGPRS